ncbi:hypothetical protein C1645_828174 [Glomus cerebriforme]|uniref:Uncharacterized protein n=1 Tax=Glomus cerebriforme TaxID=658196 RepID=A0A397SRB5_9GLOM|nr:hypothetical protein C1645_828174 [Glomus cerebriforme]
MSSNNLVSSINVNRIRHRRNRRIERQRHRIIISMYRRRAPINNTDTLSRIAQTPLQITNDPFANQLDMIDILWRFAGLERIHVEGRKSS